LLLSELIQETMTDNTHQTLTTDPDISGLCAYSRKVKPGDLFAALPGMQTDGGAFIAEAVERGALAILTGHHIKELVLTEQGAAPCQNGPDVPILSDSNPRRVFSLMAGRLHPHQPAKIAAVTGTNGKTSVAAFTRQIWERQGCKAASLGTLGLQTNATTRSMDMDGLDAGNLTTPDPVTLHKTLSELYSRGVDHLVMEASSHGLNQYRLDGVRVNAAAFTNLSRDHLDYHINMENYLQAKSRLFEDILEEGGSAVLNADTPEFLKLARIAAARGMKVMGFGRKGAYIRLEDQTPGPDGQILSITIGDNAYQVLLPLVGDFQASNALCALGLVMACGGDQETAVTALAHLEGVSGRMQHVADHANGASVYVDYAHTPGALENALRALRPHVEGRLHVVFGCGGGRDAGKRPLMGEVVERLADAVVVTDDNPRDEDPAVIRKQILAGILTKTASKTAGTVCEIGDRAEAIAASIATLKPEDLLVIAGKGHETYQIVGNERRDFDDAAIAQIAIREIAGEVRETP